MARRSLIAPGRPPLVVAHRGAWGELPQNSIAAFERAIEEGADAVELDVRRTADDRLVVVHDPRVGLHPIARLDAATVRARMEPGQAPELDDVLRTLAGRVAVDVELKEDGYVEQAMAVVTARLDPDGYVVTSFLDAVLSQVRAIVPRARTGLLLAARRPRRTLERRIEDAGVDFVAPHASLARTGLLEWTARRRLPAWVWTVNDPRTLRALLADPRVAAVITDRPGAAVRAVAALDLPDVA